MRIGVPKEIKREEYRVAITPAGVEALPLERFLREPARA